jgi:low temperature requirement protein LtrA
MAGVLIVAAGVPRAIEHWDFGTVVVGYVVMRLAMVGQWLRAATSHPEGRRCALRYAGGIALVQGCWLARQALPSGVGLGAFFLLAAAELAVPAWAEAASRTAWHPRHIAERYGLFTIIVLGETLAGTATGMQAALHARTGAGRLAAVVAGGLLLVFAMWWMYFDTPTERVVEAIRRDFGERSSGAFVWGYGHYAVFAAVAATGAGLSLSVDRLLHHSQLTALETAASVTVPTSVYLLAVWALHARAKPPGWLRSYASPAAATLILCSTFTPQPVLATGLLLVALVAVWVAGNRAPATATPETT